MAERLLVRVATVVGRPTRDAARTDLLHVARIDHVDCDDVVQHHHRDFPLLALAVETLLLTATIYVLRVREIALMGQMLLVPRAPRLAGTVC